MAKDVYEWDAEQISITLDGQTVDAFQGLAYRNAKKINHIRTINKGVVGYNRSLEEPSLEVSCDSTAAILIHAQELKKNKTYFNISYTSPSITINATNCIIRDISTGNIGETSPSVTIQMLALKIDETMKSSIVDGANTP